MIVIIMGPPGSGKGTQCNELVNKYGFTHISTGDIIRKNIKEQTRLGKIASQYIDKGHLVPDRLIVDLIKDTFDSMNFKNEKILLDGFPRTIYQAQSLGKCLETRGTRIDLVINLVVPDAVIIKRTVERRLCSNSQCGAIYNLLFNLPLDFNKCDKCGSRLIKRDDDNESIIEERLKVYHKKTAPIIEFYKNLGSIFEVQGDKSVEEIANDIKIKLEQIY